MTVHIPFVLIPLVLSILFLFLMLLPRKRRFRSDFDYSMDLDNVLWAIPIIVVWFVYFIVT